MDEELMKLEMDYCFLDHELFELREAEDEMGVYYLSAISAAIYSILQGKLSQEEISEIEFCKDLSIQRINEEILNSKDRIEKEEYLARTRRLLDEKN